MTTDNPYAATTVARSPEYNDGLTVQDVSHSAAPAPASTLPSGDEHVTTDETSDLISANKVEGTAVYDAAGERLGTVDSIMLGKRSGQVAYAVMSFGGFLGIGERYHPLPWNVLTYDQAKGGYNIQHTADDLRKAPNYSRDEVDALDYGTRGDEIDDYYGVNVAHGSTGMGANRNF
jgi:hypothetical protein